MVQWLRIHLPSRKMVLINLFEGQQMGIQGDTSGKEPTCQCRRHKRLGFHPWLEKIPWRRAHQPTPVFLPRESHGQRSLAGCSPLGRTVRHNWIDLAQQRCRHREQTYGREFGGGRRGWDERRDSWKHIHYSQTSALWQLRGVGWAGVGSGKEVYEWGVMC